MRNNGANCLLVVVCRVRYTTTMLLQPWTFRAALTVIIAAVGVLEGCIDTCVLSGNACNVSSDCEGGDVCLLPNPDDDLGCPVVTGTCGPGDCGSDADCAEGCCNLTTRQCGVAFDECLTAQCSTTDDCGFGEACVSGACRSTCNDDVDCPGSERCLGTCRAAIGTVCSIDSGFGECFNGDCVNTNAAGAEVQSYCTDGCNLDLVDSSIEGEKFACPAGYSCVDNRCLQQ